MYISEILSPLWRRKIIALLSIIVLTFLCFWGIKQIPVVEKTTIYFSVKAISNAPAGNHYYAAEGAERIAEMIAGWIKNPAFREEILTNADVYIPHFRNKISASKQNRINVFVTLKLPLSEAKNTTVLSQAVIDVYKTHMQEFNSKSSFLFDLSPPTIASEKRVFPDWWLWIGAFVIALFLTPTGIYAYEALTQKTSYISQIKVLFPTAPVLRIPEKMGKHDTKLLEQFILTFQSPRLIGTFRRAEKHFSLAVMDELDLQNDTPVLLVQLGKTSLRDLENFHSIFGEEVGIIIFERA